MVAILAMSKICTKAFGEIHNITDTVAANRIGITINMDASSNPEGY